METRERSRVGTMGMLLTWTMESGVLLRCAGSPAPPLPSWPVGRAAMISSDARRILEGYERVRDAFTTEWHADERLPYRIGSRSAQTLIF